MKYCKPLFVLGLLAWVFASCGGEMPQQTPTSYETLTIQKSDITLPVKFSAKMHGQNDATIMPQVSGQLMQICVSEGQQVKKGETLFVIDSRNAQLELEAAEANLMAAEANLSSANMEWESNKNLFEKKIVSCYMLDNAENNYKQAKAAVSQARASVNRAKVNLSFCTISAPVNGLIGDINVRVGDLVSPATHLTTLSDNANMEAEFSVTEALIEEQVQYGVSKAERQKIIEALPAAIFLMKSGTEYPHKGRVTSITGVVNAVTGTMACKATFPNPDGLLYSGIQGTVVLPFDEKDKIIIPQYAVVRLQDKSLVYKVLPDSTATAVSIQTESAGNGKDVIVTAGLNVGDQIVTVGANNVQDGQRVLF
ncbi:MAG: efflux RND transporter periplasmic adaptor subunit [Paludibacteraceae bacterium]|nr:efflux RND transporter periplasmic adaptor subunit [Paludibacteraceae bacterium]